MIARITVQDARIHGVTQLIVFCRGRRKGDWPCHHEGTIPIDRFRADEDLGEIERRCRCTACGWRKADVRPDYSKPLPPRTSVGWIRPIA
jgi:hypothetical protein